MTDNTSTVEHEQPKRGDWFKTKNYSSTIRCKEYTAPPPNGTFNATLPTNHWFGPVHEVQRYNDFVSVSVPARYRPGMLVWVNIENDGVRFAKLDRRWAGFLD